MADELPIVTGPGRLILDANRQHGRGGDPRAPKPRFVPGSPRRRESGTEDDGNDTYFPDEVPTELVQALDRLRTVGNLNQSSEETTRRLLRGQLYYQRLPAPAVDLQGDATVAEDEPKPSSPLPDHHVSQLAPEAALSEPDQSAVPHAERPFDPPLLA